MQVSVETTEGLERKLTVEIPAEQIDAEVDKRVVDTAKRVRLDGFRPGKVPRKVVKQRFGESLRAEVVSEMANKAFQDAVAQESLNLVGTPSFDFPKNEVGHNLELVATFEVLPEIELVDPSSLTLERFSAEVVDSDIDAMVEKLRDQRASWSGVSRAAIEGDQLTIDYRGTRNGEPFDGGTADGVDLELGSKRMIEGFESGLIGASANEQRTLDLTFPEDYHAKDLAGAAVQFEVTVNEVKEKELPALDEKFFELFDVDGDLAAFKLKVRENMESQLSDAIHNNLKQQVMDGLAEQNQFELPGALITQEISTLREQTVQRFGAGADNFDESLLPDEMFEEQARKRVSLGVILNRVVQDYEIKPEREQLIEFIDDIAESYEDPDEVRNLYMSDESRLQQVNLLVVEKLVVEKIVELAGTSERPASYDDVIASSTEGR